jgi:hypothetical protein
VTELTQPEVPKTTSSSEKWLGTAVIIFVMLVRGCSQAQERYREHIKHQQGQALIRGLQPQPRVVPAHIARPSDSAAG